MSKLPTEAAWARIATELDARGYAVIPKLLNAAECASLTRGWNDEAAYRKHIVMQRHGYGQGEYRYFAYPLPDLVAGLRESLYPPLAAIANDWTEKLGRADRFPETHAEYIARCHAGGQMRPTPLILKYGPGDYNRLHQDIYGAEVFPLQITVLLCDPAQDFTGGEFVLTEQRPRMQSRAEIVPLTRGDAVVFAVKERPAQGTRGTFRVQMRHGVSTVRSGERYTFGLIFHDAT